MDNNKVYCCGLSEDMNTTTQIFISSSQNKMKVQEEAQTILGQLENVLLHNFERKNIEGDLGLWCCTRETNTAYFALVNPTYPDRLSYKMLKELKSIYDDFNDNQDLDMMKKNGKKLLDKYNNPSSFDQLSKAQKGVNDVKIEMQNNLNTLIEGQEDLSDLDNQARNMKEQADQFQKGSNKIKRIMWWQKQKMTLMIIGLIIAIIVIIVVLIKVL